MRKRCGVTLDDTTGSVYIKNNHQTRLSVVSNQQLWFAPVPIVSACPARRHACDAVCVALFTDPVPLWVGVLQCTPTLPRSSKLSVGAATQHSASKKCSVLTARDEARTPDSHHPRPPAPKVGIVCVSAGTGRRKNSACSASALPRKAASFGTARIIRHTARLRAH